ncbi:DUF3040 domain-containing protein [Mycolicibacterium sphagni]|uniref:DUF3040 domain-containing protein n=1 Tax=Mycolicibacterium sphagni TaxID=1786 RepID=A0ABX2JY12_9MYCO|nr:DUF3040 domain-containing protein [Mycolicibacterium sphagni]
MTLSHHEQQAFERIADELYAEASRFDRARTSATAITANDRHRIVAGAAFVVGAATMAGAVLVPKITAKGLVVVALLGYAAMFSAALLWCRRPPCRNQTGTR